MRHSDPPHHPQQAWTTRPGRARLDGCTEGVVDEEIDRDCEELNLGLNGLGAASTATSHDHIAIYAWSSKRPMGRLERSPARLLGVLLHL